VCTPFLNCCNVLDATKCSNKKLYLTIHIRHIFVRSNQNSSTDRQKFVKVRSLSHAAVDRLSRGCDYVTAGADARMNVTSYSLTLNSTSLHPCQHDVEVFYTRPRPATTSARAMVRLYRQEVRSSPSEGTTVRAAVPATSVYVAERWATGQ